MFTKFIDHTLVATPTGADLHITLHAPTRPCAGFRKNMEHMVTHFANTTNKPLSIRYSGGLDSQAMVLAARDAGVDFHVHHLTYTSGGKKVALTDYEQSEAFAKKHGFTVEYAPMPLNETGAPFKVQSPRHIYNNDTLVLGASGDAFHYNAKNLVGADYGYNDFFYFPMDVITQLRMWSSYGEDIYTRAYSESAELFFSMLFHKSLEPFSAFIRDNPKKHKRYDLHQMKFVLLHAEYGDELLYFDKKHASDELPRDISRRHEAFAKQFWGVGNLWFKEDELLALRTGARPNLTGTMHIPAQLLWDVTVPLSR